MVSLLWIQCDHIKGLQLFMQHINKRDKSKNTLQLFIFFKLLLFFRDVSQVQLLHRTMCVRSGTRFFSVDNLTPGPTVESPHPQQVVSVFP